MLQAVTLYLLAGFSISWFFLARGEKTTGLFHEGCMVAVWPIVIGVALLEWWRDRSGR